ncbi:hypothetical protein BKA62DRAFT_681856 [Auriculariales sp. MPI-PUGE-AT-0066]|nr:hypothetical protein BKA62DRAFT_681856 [Auriculariales sp. MPI-PUGE-AT-0066]
MKPLKLGLIDYTTSGNIATQPSDTSGSIESMRIPLELFRSVVQLVVDRDDLIRLGRVCTAFRAETERVLYREVTLALDDPRGRGLCSNLPSVIHRVAKHVRRCIVHLPDRSQPTESSYPMPEHFGSGGLSCGLRLPSARRWRWLSTGQPENSLKRLVMDTIACIPHMKELQTLFVSGNVSGYKFGYTLRHTRFTKLASFTSSSILDKATLAFLESQPGIVELTTLHSRLSSSTNTLSRKALPHLSKVHALTPAIASAVVPHRPVSHVEVYVWNGDCPTRFGAALAQSHKRLKSLLTDIAIRALAGFASLKTVVIAMHTVSLPSKDRPGSDLDEAALLTQLVQACPALSTVILTIALTPRVVFTRQNAADLPLGRPAAWKRVIDAPQSLCCSMWSDD